MSSRWSISKNGQSNKFSLEKAGVPSGITDILLNRGYSSAPSVLEYLRPSLFSFYPPYLFNQMELTVKRLDKALKTREKVLIYGDYDVDGVTGTALLYKVLSRFGFNVLVHIPRREDGYGLQKDVIEKAGENSVSLILTVDCGITAVEEVKLALQNGIDVIITDHHEAPDILPLAAGILNPKVSGSGYPFQQLAGVGVAWKLVQAIYSHFGYPFENQGYELEYLDLVALGTIADLVPLIGENRILVKYGLQVMENTKNTGLKALLEECGLSGKKLKAGQIAFIMAPRINAAGRMDTARLALNLLLEENYEDALETAKLLSKENLQRQSTEKKILQEAEEILAQDTIPEVIVLSSPKWHHGVIGIVASRLVEKYNRPVFMIAEEGEVGKGSARGINGYHVLNELDRNAPLLVRYGGHKMAAGFSIEVENIGVLRKELINSILESGLIYQQQIRIDAVIPCDQIGFDLEQELQQMAPFGLENPAPLLMTSNLSVKRIQTIGKEKDHLRLFLEADRRELEVLAFKKGKEFEQISKLKKLDIIYVLETNDYFREKRLQAVLRDYREASADVLLEISCTEEQVLGETSEDELQDFGCISGLSRKIMVDFYKKLKSTVVRENYVLWQPDSDIYQLHMVKILEELGIVSWLGGTGPYLIKINADRKTDLSNSLRYRVLNQSIN